jgi:hypothetical protein
MYALLQSGAGGLWTHIRIASGVQVKFSQSVGPLDAGVCAPSQL